MMLIRVFQADLNMFMKWAYLLYGLKMQPLQKAFFSLWLLMWVVLLFSTLNWSVYLDSHQVCAMIFYLKECFRLCILPPSFLLFFFQLFVQCKRSEIKVVSDDEISSFFQFTPLGFSLNMFHQFNSIFLCESTLVKWNTILWIHIMITIISIWIWIPNLLSC